MRSWLIWLLALGLSGLALPTWGQTTPSPLPFSFPTTTRSIQGVQLIQKLVSVNGNPIPVSMVVVNPAQPGTKVRPFWTDPSQLTGLESIAVTASQRKLIAAINGGFFNRITQQPLGAIRKDSAWISSPILGRGVVAWTDPGQFRFERLQMQGQVQLTNGESLPVTTFNSAYLLPGLAQYTSAWGATYTTKTDQEIVIQVQGSTISAITPAGLAGSLKVDIPTQGYVLVARQVAGRQEAQRLSVGGSVTISFSFSPPDLATYPHILGAGPLLIKDKQIVLDAELEQFQPGFRTQRAARSAIGQTQQGLILLVTAGRGQENTGISLLEMAELMMQLDCVAALNLDGGSSSSLYFGGESVDLGSGSGRILPRVHNGLGIGGDL